MFKGYSSSNAAAYTSTERNSMHVLEQSKFKPLTENLSILF